jgi:hypothetical protein
MAEGYVRQPTEINLLKKEIEIQGEMLASERAERRAEVDQLRLEIETLKKVLESRHPGFKNEFAVAYQEECQSFNPDSGETLEPKEPFAA